MSNRTICEVDTPDPWMVPANGKFYLTFTLGNRIEIWTSQNMEDFHNCQKSLIWQPQHGSKWSADIWAPELHFINDTWYIYFCGAHPEQGNPSHRTLVLRSSSPDPLVASAWTFLGPLRGLPEDQWSIDATVFSLGPNELYCCYSGWPLGDHSDTQQDLFLVKLASPEVAIPDSLVCISRASLPWERPENGRRGVNEGPTWVSLPGFKGIVYSANGSWTCDYQLGLLQYLGGDPLDEKSWKKREAPLLVCDPAHGPPFGPGHASFIHSPHNDGSIYCIYHGTERPDEGWNNRKARILRLTPQHFHPQAKPVCCAYNHPSQHGGQTTMQSQPGYPGSLPSQSTSQAGQHHQHRSGNIGQKVLNIFRSS